MAHLNGVFYSKILARPVHYTAVLCNDNAGDTTNNPHYKRETKAVYLLHGYSGNDTDWFVNVPLGELANQYNVNFFMPCGDNSFYLNQKATGFQYADFVGVEFVEYTRKTFGLSGKREDTFICGLSMGGFGALHTAFQFPETFSKTMGLSSALIINGLKGMKEGEGNPVANYEYYHQMFGDFDQLDTSENNPEVLVEKILASGKDMPDIYMACGTEDFLIEPNRQFKAFLDSKNVKATFFTGPGIHDFNFWRAQLKASLEWAFS